MKIAMILTVALLAGCTPKPANMPLGKEVAPPIGAVDYCIRNPKDELCHE